MTTVKEKLDRIKRRAFIREHIQANIIMPILREQDDGGDYGYDGGGDGQTGGYTPAGSLTAFFESDFAKIFGFAAMRDIGKVALGGARKIATKVTGEAAIAFKSLAFTLIPFIAPDAGNIMDMAKQDREGMKAKMAEISSGYADILKKNDAIFSNPDFSLMAFIANPGLMVAGYATKSAGVVVDAVGDVAGQLYDSFVPGDSNRSSYYSSKNNIASSLEEILNLSEDENGNIDYGHLLAGLSGHTEELKKHLSQQQRSLSGAAFSGLREQVAQTQQAPVAPQNITDKLIAAIKANPTPQVMALVDKLRKIDAAEKQYLQSPLAIANVNKSPVVQEGRQFLVNQVVDAAKKTFDEITVSNLKSKYAAKIADYFKSQGVEDPAEQEKMLADPKAQKILVSTIKSTFLPAYIKQLDELLKLNPAGLSRQVAEAKKTIEGMAAQVS